MVRSARGVVALAVAGLVGLGTLVAPAAQADTKSLRVWVDKEVADEMRKALPTTYQGATVEIVGKDFGKIRDDLKTIDVAAAPDIIYAAHDWTGELVANGSVVKLTVPASVRSQFPKWTLDAFTIGRSLYGTPLQTENVALVTNLKLAKVPTSWADMERQALAFYNKDKRNRIALSIPGGDTYHFHPIIAALCGYLFGTNAAGSFDAYDLGVANARFLRNSSQIDRWTRSGFLNGKVDYGIAQDKFVKGLSPYWVIGPWVIAQGAFKDLGQFGKDYTITALPKGQCSAAPMLGSRGFMVTKFASQHGVDALAKSFVTSELTAARFQTAVAPVLQRMPANSQATVTGLTGRLLTAFAKAAPADARPMPNIPQMGAVWANLGSAISRATTLQANGRQQATARAAFTAAARAINSAID